MILSIDTTSEFASIALTEGERTVDEILLHSPDGFGHILYGRLEQLLSRNCVTIQQIDCFAAASGPGSFTGVRVGLTAVKGLAEATGRRVVAVSNLRALAFFGSSPMRATVLDARRGEVYGALYDDRLDAVAPETVTKFSEWLKTLPTAGYEFISNDFSPFQSHVNPAIPVVTAPRAMARAIGSIAWIEIQRGHTQDPSQIDANYVRRSDAELFWKE